MVEVWSLWGVTLWNAAIFLKSFSAALCCTVYLTRPLIWYRTFSRWFLQKRKASRTKFKKNVEKAWVELGIKLRASLSITRECKHGLTSIKEKAAFQSLAALKRLPFSVNVSVKHIPLFRYAPWHILALNEEFPLTSNASILVWDDDNKFDELIQLKAILY